MADLSDILTSAATLIRQSDETEDEGTKSTLRGAARTLLETVNVQLTPAAVPQAEDDEED